MPEAHVEAPTAGSVLLAGLLLKLGGYGFYIVLILNFIKISLFFQPAIFTLCFFSAVYIAAVAIAQTDLKKIIAYCSIMHMSIVTAGLFSFHYCGILGAIILMIGHGFISSGLFFLIGVLYKRYETREIDYYGGFAKIMPKFSLFLFIFILANISFPLTVNFLPEILILVGIVYASQIYVLLLIPSILLITICTFLFFVRIVFGEVKNNYFLIYVDITFLEFLILVVYSFPVFY